MSQMADMPSLPTPISDAAYTILLLTFMDLWGVHVFPEVFRSSLVSHLEHSISMTELFPYFQALSSFNANFPPASH
jgi:hypothetical protein